MADQPITLLFVDDDDGIRRLVERGLTRQGLRVVPAGDAASGIALLKDGGIDVVALDQNMPGIDGLAALAQIRDMPDAPPVIFVTASQESKIAVSALTAGAVDYVHKDVHGEFINLLRVAAEKACKAEHIRRARDDAEAEVRAARDRFEKLAVEREMLLREVNHRVGNSLQLIASMLQLQSNSSNADSVKAALQEAMSRVMAVAQLHRRLYTSHDVQVVAVDQYLDAIIGDLNRTVADRTQPQLTLSCDRVETDPDRAVAVGVIVNELVVNAMKYAYPNGSGPIRVKLKSLPNERATLTVEDDGIGFSESGTAQSTGLGQRIVKAMAVKLGAEVVQDTAHPGARTVISFDVANASAA